MINKIKSSIDNGKELLDAGNYVEAKDIFEKLYLEHPENKEVQNYLGIVLFKLGLHKEAVELYKLLLEKSPKYPSLHLNLGIIYYKEGVLDLALQEFSSTVEFDPSNKRAQNYLGLIYMAKGDLQKALEMFTLTDSQKMIKEVADKIQAAEEAAKRPPEPVEEEGREKLPEVTRKEGVSKEMKIPNIHETATTTQPAPQSKEQRMLSMKETAENLKSNIFKSVTGTDFFDTYQNLIKFEVTDEIYTKLSLLESFNGNLSFKGVYQIVQKNQTATPLGSAEDPIFNIQGKGSLILCIGNSTITPFTMNNEDFYVREMYLLAFNKGISYENSSKSFAEDFELIKLYGTGSIILITKTKPITLFIDDDNPLAIKLEYIIGWYGDLTSHIVKGKESLFKRREDSKWVTFKGNGYVFCLVKE